MCSQIYNALYILTGAQEADSRSRVDGSDQRWDYPSGQRYQAADSSCVAVSVKKELIEWTVEGSSDGHSSAMLQQAAMGIVDLDESVNAINCTHNQNF
jgi:hypothetical protein